MKITVIGSEAEGKVKYAIDGNGEYNKTQLGCVAVELGLKHLIENKGMSLQQAVEFINDIKPDGKWKIVTDEAGVFAEGRHKVVEFTTSKGNHTVYVNNQWTPLRSDNFIIGFNERFADGAAVAAPAANADAEKAKAEADKAKANASASLNGVEYVDLGLPSGLKWAKMNLGATKPEEAGWYIAWGELRPKADYSPSTSLTDNKDSSKLKSEGIIDDKENLTAVHDVASKVCGGKWRMPTKADFDELLVYCTWELTTMNDVKGYKVKSTMPGNVNWIFLPIAGGTSDTKIHYADCLGEYWSSTYSINSQAWSLSFNTNNYKRMAKNYHFGGMSIRPVSE